MNSFKYLAVF